MRLKEKMLDPSVDIKEGRKELAMARAMEVEGGEE